jgi:hypothetical protein
VRHHVANINSAGSIVDAGGEAVLVSTNVEDRKLTHRIRVWISLAYIHQTGPRQAFRYSIPVIEWRLCVPVRAGKLAKGFAAYDAHIQILSK